MQKRNSGEIFWVDLVAKIMFLFSREVSQELGDAVGSSHTRRFQHQEGGAWDADGLGLGEGNWALPDVRFQGFKFEQKTFYALSAQGYDAGAKRGVG